ncbi:hypothetical protein [Neisseria polysaccharea]|uniref:hypothetical protein n=1 Tax=Neisseria polysaccharea TaxID=489 RepID=UPI0027E0F4F6|nr:hypothetical protein [Neisseria polysaccharea]
MVKDVLYDFAGYLGGKFAKLAKDVDALKKAAAGRDAESVRGVEVWSGNELANYKTGNVRELPIKGDIAGKTLSIFLMPTVGDRVGQSDKADMQVASIYIPGYAFEVRGNKMFGAVFNRAGVRELIVEIRGNTRDKIWLRHTDGHYAKKIIAG